MTYQAAKQLQTKTFMRKSEKKTKSKVKKEKKKKKTI